MITLYTTNWGGYWEKYGEQWTNCVNNLNTKPDRVIIISDEPIDTEFEVILTHVPERAILSHFRNVAVDNCDTEFIVCLDLDDEAFSNYIDDINTNYDMHGYSCSRDTGADLHPNPGIYDGLFDYQEYNTPAPSFSAIRVSAIRDCGGYPSIEFEDAGMIMRLRKNNKTMFTDKVLRLHYNDLNDSLSRGDVSHKVIEMQSYFLEMKNS